MENTTSIRDRFSGTVLLLGSGVAIGLTCSLCVLLFAFIASRAGGSDDTAADDLPTKASIAELPPLPPTFTPRPTVRVVEAVQPRPTETRVDPSSTPSLPPPTATALPTTSPPPTPTTPSYNLVTALHIDGYDVRIEKVEVMSRIPGLTDDSVPTGRYAVVFLLVTRTTSLSSSFIPTGSLSVIDDAGREYEEDIVATGQARYHFYTDFMVNIEAGSTVRIVAVYDITSPATQYYLVPGLLVDPQPNWIALSVPNGDTLAPGPRATETPYIFTDDYDPPPRDDSAPPPSSDDPYIGCCRVCTTGKACGNTCISRSYTCNVGPGCACNAAVDEPLALACIPPSSTWDLAAMGKGMIACSQ